MFRNAFHGILLTVLYLAIAGNLYALDLPKIDRRPAPVRWGRGRLDALPEHTPGSTNPFQVDLRCYDASDLDLRNRGTDLIHASFDDRTQWPPTERMPAEFDPGRIMRLGRNPGLGVRTLHDDGITGRGVGIAILDQPLLVDHPEYADRIRLYEEINIPTHLQAQMHGPAVASIAVGKTVGVAPQADLYYIALFNGDFDRKAAEGFTSDFGYLARAVDRILEINEQLPEENRIRVISASVGWHSSQKGYAQITEAVAKARAAGMLIICSSVDEVHGFRFHGLGRDPSADPDDFNTWGPGSWWAAMFHQDSPHHTGRNRLLVPMDARTTASPTGVGEYVFYGEGGWSWSIPWIAGLYALAAQVEPEITPDRFWALAMKTGRVIHLQRNGESRAFGPIADPVRLIEALRRDELSDPVEIAAELARYAVTKPASPDISPPSDQDIAQQFASAIHCLDLDMADRQDVIDLLGEPLRYVLGNRTFAADELPDRYAMIYPADVQVIVDSDRIQRIVLFRPGFLYRDRIQVGTPVSEVFALLGTPQTTVDGADSRTAGADPQDNVLYTGFNGRPGDALYRNRAQGLSLLLRDNRVHSLILLPKNPG